MGKDCTKLKIEDIVEFANRGDVEAEYELGCRFENGLDVGQDSREALKWHLKAAGRGHADALLAAAGIYYWGRGVRRDREKSQWFFLKACSCFERDFKALRNPGRGAFRIYEILYGKYTGDRYVKQADEWLRKAMDANYPEAFCELARRHYLGENIRESNKKAIALYERAISLLDPEEDETAIFKLEEAVKELNRQEKNRSGK